mmetsp:Transcript_64756/g.128016  ORF Transcript_64756/g.128016 Transcript_64756/m.128016 type:complete len:653 (-) Transcript_64756:1006-2964(-)
MRVILRRAAGLKPQASRPTGQVSRQTKSDRRKCAGCATRGHESRRGGLHASLGGEVSGELGEDLLHLLVGRVVNRAFLDDVVEDARVRGIHVGDELLLEGADLRDGELVEVATRARVDGDHLVGEGHGHILVLLEQLSKARTAVEERLGGRIEVGAELGEGRNLTVLRELELEGAGDLLHRLALRSGADTRHGETDVDSGTDATVEELRLKEDLAVGDGDHVGGDVGGHIASLGLNDGEGSQRAGEHLIRHLSSTLEQTGMKVENVTRVGLATGGTTQEQRHLAVRDGLLREIVENDERVHAVVAEVLAQGAAGVGSKELQGGSVGGGRGDDDGVIHRARVAKGLHELSDGGALLADGNVDAVERLALVTKSVDALLVDDGVDGDSGLARLTIADDELTLATADGHKRVHGLEAGLHRLMHRLARDDTRGFHLDTLPRHVGDDALAVNRVAEAIDDTAEHAITHGDVNDSARALHRVTLLDRAIVTEHDNTNVVVLQVERHATQAGVKLNHLAGLHVLQAVHARNTVTDRQHLADLLELDLAAVVHDLGLDDSRQLGRRRGILLGRCARRRAKGCSRDAREAAGWHGPQPGDRRERQSGPVHVTPGLLDVGRLAVSIQGGLKHTRRAQGHKKSIMEIPRDPPRGIVRGVRHA